MIDKKQARLRRASQDPGEDCRTEGRALVGSPQQLSTSMPQVISACGSKVLAAASSLEPGLRKILE
jgi:large subunit ribosomal protein L18